MTNRKLKRIIKSLQNELLDIKAIIEALEDIEQANYPSNQLLEIVKIFSRSENPAEKLNIFCSLFLI